MTSTYGITLEILSGPDLAVEGEEEHSPWEHHRYTLQLTRGYDYAEDRKNRKRFMHVPWKQGLGITDDPDVATVLDALLSDASTVDNTEGFEQWANELGYDPDSRKAESMYRDVLEQTELLRNLLGDDYETALHAERL